MSDDDGSRSNISSEATTPVVSSAAISLISIPIMSSSTTPRLPTTRSRVFWVADTEDLFPDPRPEVSVRPLAPGRLLCGYRQLSPREKAAVSSSRASSSETHRYEIQGTAAYEMTRDLIADGICPRHSSPAMTTWPWVHAYVPRGGGIHSRRGLARRRGKHARA